MNFPRQLLRNERGSVFVLVLWICFGLVVLAVYFANSMNFELKAADNRYAAVQANVAINGAARYASYILTTYATNGVMPDRQYYRSEAIPVGEATVWYLGEPLEEQPALSEYLPSFGLVDEASKLNLNTATATMLQGLPGMTVEFAAAIVDWRDTDSDLTESGAEAESYQRLTPARNCKNGPFESIDELRLVYGATIEMIYGEDLNRNGILDPNENDGTVSAPFDNADGRLDKGLIAYVTVSSRQPRTKADGTARVNVSSRNDIRRLLEEKFGASRGGQIAGQLGNPNTQFNGALQFYVQSGMTADEFAQIEDEITTSTQAVVDGLINVNTASETVLACIPGIGEAKAPTLVSRRSSNPPQQASLAWVKEVLDRESINQASRYLTGKTYQFSADVVGVGRFNRGVRRTRFVFDTTESVPRIVYRQDLTQLGWPLGEQLRRNLQLATKSRL